MAQQTAVDWIVDQMLSEGHKEMWKDTIQQAKQLEKDQIVRAASTVLWHNSSNSTETAEQYYNETYGK